ncbi:hypothetical protein NBRC116188_09430 [Oceaniserpentilla sp. 4NH20-0058]|uniref:hypothetical protein n=1 Tax=Oceaniserpentilla sp. 4NH20-0058 TaxID=3127660 RepID=UPI003107602B
MEEKRTSEEAKVKLEHDAAKLFMRQYEQLTGHRIRHIWHNRPQRPDVSCMLDGERLDLEIAHLYGSSQEAMDILKQGINANVKHQLELQEAFSNTRERLINALNAILKNKASKKYDSNRVWLVIRNAHPAWDREQVLNAMSEIQIPDGYQFDQIWLVADFMGKSGVVRLT